MQFLLVGIGGVFGSLSRFSLGKYISKRSNSCFPIGTAIINITGAILLGMVSTMSVNKNIYLLFGDGFLGAFTTFSTFMYESVNLFQYNSKLNGYIYIIMSVTLGIIGYILGTKLGPLIIQ